MEAFRGDVANKQLRPNSSSLITHLATDVDRNVGKQHEKTHVCLGEVKETLDATSKYVKNKYGKTELHVNQYIFKEEIGRGSFGAVHLAQDHFGTEYAIKEFSKSRLRRNSRSKLLKRLQHDRTSLGPQLANCKLGSPCTAASIHVVEPLRSPLQLISGEIEAMKRTNHPNIVRLFEVLDDPEVDSIYMVLEMCKKGVITDFGIGKRADPQPVENCRRWFRQMINGVSHCTHEIHFVLLKQLTSLLVHNQGVVHRDIKPDNLLLSDDNVLKIVDFGISEIFEKGSDMMVFKSAGSPAFTPPELCIPKHGYVSGKAADIWSVGVSIYCLRFGYLPFEHAGILELYDAIRNENLKLDIDPTQEPEFLDLMTRLLDKNPKTRINMNEIKVHPWVTKMDIDPLPVSVQKKPKDSIDVGVKNVISDQQMSKKTTHRQRFANEIWGPIPSLVFKPVSFSGKPQSSDLSSKLMSGRQGSHAKVTVSKQYLENLDPKFRRQRVDSAIDLESDELNLHETLNSLAIENTDVE